METVLYCRRQMTAFLANAARIALAPRLSTVVRSQRRALSPESVEYYFKEWLAAIHLFHRDGTHALMSRYAYRSHPAKVEPVLSHARIEHPTRLTGSSS